MAVHIMFARSKRSCGSVRVLSGRHPIVPVVGGGKRKEAHGTGSREGGNTTKTTSEKTQEDWHLPAVQLSKLGRTNFMVCPVAALLSYLVLRGKGEGPLFQFKDGRALTRPLLVSELRKALAEAGLKPENYAGHSFRIGAATTAAACGIPVKIIKTLGHWKSQAYQLYVRLPTDQLSSISKKLVQSNL